MKTGFRRKLGTCINISIIMILRIQGCLPYKCCLLSWWMRKGPQGTWQLRGPGEAHKGPGRRKQQSDEATHGNYWVQVTNTINVRIQTVVHHHMYLAQNESTHGSFILICHKSDIQVKNASLSSHVWESLSFLFSG